MLANWMAHVAGKYINYTYASFTSPFPSLQYGALTHAFADGVNTCHCGPTHLGENRQRFLKTQLARMNVPKSANPSQISFSLLKRST